MSVYQKNKHNNNVSSGSGNKTVDVAVIGNGESGEGGEGGESSESSESSARSKKLRRSQTTATPTTPSPLEEYSTTAKNAKKKKGRRSQTKTSMSFDSSRVKKKSKTIELSSRIPRSMKYRKKDSMTEIFYEPEEGEERHSMNPLNQLQTK